VKALQNLDSQGLIWKIFRNKDLEGKIGPESGWRQRESCVPGHILMSKSACLAKGLDGDGPFAGERLLTYHHSPDEV
jgi:hypothetical protein